jgi:hypothetical protein
MFIHNTPQCVRIARAALAVIFLCRRGEHSTSNSSGSNSGSTSSSIAVALICLLCFLWEKKKRPLASVQSALYSSYVQYDPAL